MQSTPDQSHSSEAISAILDALPTALILTALDGSIEFLNDPAAELFGYERQELIGQPVEVLIPAPRRQRHREHREEYSSAPRYRVMGTGGLWPATRKDGGEFPAEVGLTPISIAGTTHVLATVIDISERKRTEDLEKLAEIGQVAMGMTREVAGPLRTIADSTQRMMRMQVPANVREQMRHVSEQASRVSRTVQNVLVYSQAQELHQTDLDLGDLLRKIADRFVYTGPMSRSTTTFIDLVLSQELPPIQGDAALLEIVFENLIENSRQAGVPRNGAVKITISASEQDDSIDITLADDGPGLPAGQEDHIFRPFFTTGKTNNSQGLGLSVSKAIVEQHGGQMWADARTENGATFRIVLPLPGQVTQLDLPDDRQIDDAIEYDPFGQALSGAGAGGQDNLERAVNPASVELPQVRQSASAGETDTLVGPVNLLILPPVDHAAVLQLVAYLRDTGNVTVEETQTTNVGSVRLSLTVHEPYRVASLRSMPLVLDIHEEARSKQISDSSGRANLKDLAPKTLWLLLRSG